MKILKKLQILFWKNYAKIWDLRPRLHLPEHCDYPIASTDIREGDDYEYPEGIKILFEWDEKGKHWVVFTRK